MNTRTDGYTQSATVVRLVAAAICLAMFGSGYAISKQGEAPGAPAAVAIPTSSGEPPQGHFPPQHKSLASEIEEHIQAF